MESGSRRPGDDDRRADVDEDDTPTQPLPRLPMVGREPVERGREKHDSDR